MSAFVYSILTATSQWLAQGLRALVPLSDAATFEGGGLWGGVEQASGIGVPAANLTDIVITIIITVLNLIALVAVAVVIYAGILLIISLGDDAKKDQAKKTIIYMAIGLAIIILSRIIVTLLINIITP
ncbi:MAG: hypothetical protein WCV62_00380 [Candidatus Peribacteraceae bacterium]|jgi:hypothetical protein